MGTVHASPLTLESTFLIPYVNNIHNNSSPQERSTVAPFKNVDQQLSPLSTDFPLEAGPAVDAETAFKRYQHALMVYSTERYKLSSSRPSEQKEINLQLNDLRNQGITLIESEEQVPQELRSYFTGTSKNGKDKMARLYFEELGLSVRAFIDDKNQKVYISFRGTDFSNWNSIKSAVSISSPEWIGSTCFLPYVLKSAKEVVEAFRQHYPGFSMVTLGYSQGGAIAIYLALNTDDVEKAYVFNTQIPAPCLIQGASEERSSRVVSTYVENDMLNDASYSPLAMVTWFFRHQGTEPFQSTMLPVDPTLGEKILYSYNKVPWDRLSYYQQARSILSHGFIRHSPTAVLEAAHSSFKRATFNTGH